ncbi:sporulation initiation factor Spo0A C-terminal domain-containing protein, partial [Ruminococcus flavefaciens]|uniref:sporulation initiation factor Spo0A C-terminal domain-containing protein n=1 Tax=Ruminococcus flavefaciens TaxID=1265 RepID=UPI0025D4FDDA
EMATYIHDGMELPIEDWSKTLHSFSDLATIIQTTNDAAQSSAVKAINRMQTMRNWLIGYYIVEFEQHGKDRAEYGANLLKSLKEKVNRRGLNETLFKNSRNFYLLYPQIADELNSSVKRIERGLRYSIEAAWDRNSDGIKDILGYYDDCKPYLSEFIWLLADKYRIINNKKRFTPGF